MERDIKGDVQGTLMVERVSVTRLNARGGVVVDLEAWMHHPNDFDFRPRISLTGSELIFDSASDGSRWCTAELDDDMVETLLRDRSVTLRVKFGVHGMHGRLDRINPIIADGKAKKLANANWKTVQPVHLE